MIVVLIQLFSARGEEKDKPLGIIKIHNDGTGDTHFGNYKYELSHAGKYIRRKGAYKKGRIEKFPRKASPYRLISRCLRHAGEI
jgi:hypothetical protein